MGKSVYFCSTCKFPEGDAGSIYYSNLAKCVTNDLNEILLVGAGKTKYSTISKDEKSGIDVISLRKYRNNFFSRLISHFTIKKNIIRYIFRHASSIKLLVIDGSFSLRQYNFIYRFFCKHNPKTKIVICVLERYQKEEFDKKLLTYKMIKNNNKFINKFNKKDCYIICISSYLQSIFEKRGFKCLRVPFIFDSNLCITPEQKRIFRCKDNKIRFIYAGSPSKKDLIVNIISGLFLLPDSYLKRIDVYVIGTTKEWLFEHGINDYELERFSSKIHILGRLPHSEVEKIYEICDYSLLARDENMCFSKAGFPTKVSESLLYCVVPITNFTSDLSMYLKDGVNSIIIDGHSPEAISIAVKKAIDCFFDIDRLKVSANSTLIQELSTQTFSIKIKEFLSL